MIMSINQRACTSLDSMIRQPNLHIEVEEFPANASQEIEWLASDG
jgi:hypothetical protein